MLNQKAVVYLLNQCQSENPYFFWRTAHSPNVMGNMKKQKLNMVLASFFLMLIISCSSGRKNQSLITLPEIESNYDSLDFVGHTNKKLIDFSKNKDFVFAYSNVSFWGGYSKRYDIISLKNGIWSCYKYDGDIQYGKKFLLFTIWKKDSFANGKFKLQKRDISNEAIELLFNFADDISFWKLNQDSVNIVTHFPNERIADAATKVFDIISKDKKKSLSVEPNRISETIHRQNFDEMTIYFHNWKAKYCP